VVAVEIGLRLLYGRLAFGQALFILILAPEFYQPLRNLGARFHAGMEGVAGADRLFSLLRIRPSIVQTTAATHPSPPTGNLVLKDVRFTYPNADQPALDGLTCEIHAGRTTALVGASGAGKSTVAHLLLRFADPQEGVIQWGEDRLVDFSPAALRAQIAWVPQNPYLFNDTVAENIRLGQPDASLSSVIHAAQLANIHAFVESLPHKYETVIGERGARLSGGEGQRLALARAFLKDAPFIILDEPSANLDPAGEAQLMEALSRLLRGRTALIIAHRLPTVVSADQVLVLAGGRLIEQGSHHQLVELGGTYSQLVQVYGGLR
jgi:ABC-type transport system involved in cytochrome bd biosynthesis fused ATPase/permease subunit